MGDFNYLSLNWWVFCWISVCHQSSFLGEGGTSRVPWIFSRWLTPLTSRRLERRRLRSWVSSVRGRWRSWLDRFPPWEPSWSSLRLFADFLKDFPYNRASGWCQLTYFLECSPRKLGKMFTHFDDRIFFKWLGKNHQLAYNRAVVWVGNTHVQCFFCRTKGVNLIKQVLLKARSQICRYYTFRHRWYLFMDLNIWG